jgi:magnesium transporter
MLRDPESQAHLQARIGPVAKLLDRIELVEGISHRQSPTRAELVDALTHRQMLAEVSRRLGALPAGDVAHLMETLRPDRRVIAWEQLSPEAAGKVLWELSPPISATLVEETPRDRLVTIARALDADGLAHVARWLPADVLGDVRAALEPRTRAWLAEQAAFPEDSAGRLMSHEFVVVESGETIRQVFKRLRRPPGLPDQTDTLYVVDERDRLVGAVRLQVMIRHPLRTRVEEIADRGIVTFRPDEEARTVALAFERYDLASAPVLDERGRLVGQLTFDELVHYSREQADRAALRRAGLRGDEDLLGSIWLGARQRWLWLGVNLATAFLASRVIGAFEGSIARLVALATLMPIVASIGGNTGNQTATLFIRGLALQQLNTSNLALVAAKELSIALLNGVMWGSVLGLVTLLLYGSVGLGAVMAAATALNLLVAAIVGMGVPVVMHKVGRDPALGSSVLLTFTTDSMGFFIFLGLATLVLLR